MDCKLKGTERKVKTNCAACGKEIEIHKSQFERTKNNYCNPECRAVGQVTTEKRNCDYCGKKIDVQQFKLKKSDLHFCNAECFGLFSRKRTNTQCAYCGERIERHLQRVETYEKQFCSQACYGKWQSLNSFGANNRNYVERIIDYCPVCGDEVERLPWHIKAFESKFCSKKCLSEHRKVVSLGEKNPNWKGGLSFDEYSLDFNEGLKRKIRNRDGNICHICFKSSEDSVLMCHHIDYDKKNSGFCDKVEDREGILNNNFITLCNSCHGKTNANRTAWERYFNSTGFWLRHSLAIGTI